jgi:hypothetical protein
MSHPAIQWYILPVLKLFPPTCFVAAKAATSEYRGQIFEFEYIYMWVPKQQNFTGVIYLWA